MINESIQLLGANATDKVTGFNGVITSVCFDLYGCVQVILTPTADEKGDVRDGRWFDIGRLRILSRGEMAAPTFTSLGLPTDYHKGPAEKSPPGMR